MSDRTERKHPLEMSVAERRARKGVIGKRLAAIEARLAKKRSLRADPEQPDGVEPDLENEWAHLESERRQIEALEAKTS